MKNNEINKLIDSITEKLTEMDDLKNVASLRSEIEKIESENDKMMTNYLNLSKEYKNLIIKNPVSSSVEDEEEKIEIESDGLPAVNEYLKKILKNRKEK